MVAESVSGALLSGVLCNRSRVISKDKATFDKMNPRDFERATGTTLDAFFYKPSPWVTVWHNGNELQIQISFSNDAGKARAKTEELKLADIAVTRF